MRSGSVDEKGEEEEDGEDDDKENMYEEAFAKMKRAAGVSEIEEVVHRYVRGGGSDCVLMAGSSDSYS